MQFKDYHDFLMTKFMKEEPQILDDDLPDQFDNWLQVLGVDDWIRYGDEYFTTKKSPIIIENYNYDDNK